jgi:uncharacterized protein YukE
MVMNMSILKINTAQITASAAAIDTQKTRIENTLDTDCRVMGRLSSWQGQAADKFIGIFNKFTSKNYPNTPLLFGQYTDFLRENIAQGYREAEKTNVDLGELFL